MEQSIIVRFSEITLKGRNRYLFEQQMARNLRAHLEPHGDFHIRPEHVRTVVSDSEHLPTAVEILKGLPGVANLSLAYRVPTEPEALTGAVLEYVAGLPQRREASAERPLRFKVEVERKDKRYPMSSMDLAAHLGRAILERFEGFRVDLTQPEVTVMVEVWQDAAAIFSEKIPGPGGLAVGSSGTVVCLLSGGIDSPVAAYQMMTRGCRTVFLNFHSFPFIGEQSKEKVHDLVRFMARFQPHSRLYVAPFAEAQKAIRDYCPESLRTVLYRRMMNRVANHIAAREQALGLVTGESLGQVASQTLENIMAIQETAVYPVLQPLIGMSKQEITQRARHMGTYDISILPYPDCCTLFQPKHPETRARLREVHRAESRLPVEELVARCLEAVECNDYGPEYYPAGW